MCFQGSSSLVVRHLQDAGGDNVSYAEHLCALLMGVLFSCGFPQIPPYITFLEAATKVLNSPMHCGRLHAVHHHVARPFQLDPTA